jgi:hypothetical protein
MAASAWWRDFELNGTVLHVRKTGARVPIEPGVIGEFLAWLHFYLEVELERRALNADGPRIWFSPDAPRPWYLIWPAVQLAGLRIARTPDAADLAMFFEDRTAGEPPRADLPVINAHCPDTSKSAVGRAFEQASGRALSVDPASATGPLVEKGEANGVHDGRVVEGPCPALEGKSYQRLIDNLAVDGLVEDLRCPTVEGDVAAVFLKRRPVETRFANANAEVRLLDADTVFTDDERALIKRFCKALGLDWGGLDVLRDTRDGQLWIVDANKTDMGPPTALPLRDKLAATRAIGARLRQYCDRLIEDPPGARP